MTNHAKCGVPAADVFVEGGRAGVLLVHRLGGTPADFSYFTTKLSAEGYSVACPQLYGHGGSRALLAATTARDWMASVSEAYVSLRQRCDVVVAAGHAEGAFLVLELALTRAAAPPDALVLLAPCAWPDGSNAAWHAPLLRWVRVRRLASAFRLDERAPFGIKDEALRRTAVAEMLSDGRPPDDVFGRSAASWMEIAALARGQDLARIPLRTLIVHPRRGDRSKLARALDIQCRLAGRVDTVVLDDSGSFVMRDRQRDYAVERVLAFLGDIVAERQ